MVASPNGGLPERRGKHSDWLGELCASFYGSRQQRGWGSSPPVSRGSAGVATGHQRKRAGAAA